MLTHTVVSTTIYIYVRCICTAVYIKKCVRACILLCAGNCNRFGAMKVLYQIFSYLFTLIFYVSCIIVFLQNFLNIGKCQLNES